METLRYAIGLSLIPKIGPVTARKLIAYCGSPEAVFKQNKAALEKIPGIGTLTAALIVNNHSVLDRADLEIAFIQKHNINPLYYFAPEYPQHLKECDDSPLVLYTKGKVNFNSGRLVSIVGTRNITAEGRQNCQKLIEGLAEYKAVIVSGLAYGVDICAHKAALDNGLKTIAVLSHGLDRIYPQEHLNTAKDIVRQGAIVTEFLSQTPIDRNRFLQRNRIIAGLSKATIIIESADKGGALSTAEMGISYHRDIYAFPGRPGDKFSAGCNALIKNGKARLIENYADVIKLLDWKKDDLSKKNIQKKLFYSPSPDEALVLKYMETKTETYLDDICLATKIPISKMSPLLLNLEFAGIIKPLPGKTYILT